MTLPKMIIFDYGDTLLYEPDINMLRGQEAIFQYIKRNKNNVTPADVCEFSWRLYQEKTRAAREVGLEIHEWQHMRLLYEYLEIELSISYPEAEQIFYDHTTPGAAMPGADKLLDYIKSCGIRSGVISNNVFSEPALTARFNRLLPNHQFEFIIVSSEYGYRKPHCYLFELALKKAGLDASEVWFCGDNIEADVEGASAIGIFPVWYTNMTIDNPHRIPYGDTKPQCKHLHIQEWDELIEALEKMQ